MTDRDRLIELLKASIYGNIDEGFYGPELDCENVADYLLANGVVVPPCKLGNTVWFLYGENNILKMVCVGFLKTNRRLFVEIARNTNVFTTRYHAIWGEEVFSTKEKAELKMKEKYKNAK